MIAVSVSDKSVVISSFKSS